MFLQVTIRVVIVAMACTFAPLYARAGILTATHAASSGLSGNPTIQSSLFGIGSATISDRTHSVKKARFDTNSNSLSLGAVGGSISELPFPSYLTGGQFVTVNQANRVATDYQLTITTDTPSFVYLLLDNRAKGSPNSVAGSEYNDPDLIDALTWVTANGWQRINTGLTPNGAGDYVGIDESNDDTPNHFYAVYRNTTVGNSITLSGLNQSVNMYAPVVTPVPEPNSLALVLIGGAAVGCLAGRYRTAAGSRKNR